MDDGATPSPLRLVYEDEWTTLYHGDLRYDDRWAARDVPKVLVADPPYGMKFQSGMRTITPKSEPIHGDADTEVRDRMLEIWGTDRPAIVFGTWRVSPPVGETQRLIWFKEGGGAGMGDLTKPWGTTHEDIYVLGEWWSKDEAGVKRRGSGIITHGGIGGHHGINNKYGHPTAKPVGVMEQLIECVPAGVVVVDPCAGAGSTLVAARNLGHRSIGVEKDLGYCDRTIERLLETPLRIAHPKPVVTTQAMF